MSCVLVTLIIKHNEMPCGTGDCTPKRKSSFCLSVSPPHCFSVYSACQPVCLSTSPSVCPPVSVSPQSVHLLNASSMALGGGSRQRCVSAAARLPPVFLCAIAIYAPQSAPLSRRDHHPGGLSGSSLQVSILVSRRSVLIRLAD